MNARRRDGRDGVDQRSGRAEYGRHQEMTAQSTQVSNAISSIAAVSEEQSAATEHVSSSAEEMSAQAEEFAATARELRRLSARFTMSQPATNLVMLRKAA